MYDSNEYDSYRYAQMQSSILNKTGSSMASASSPNKVNLKNKFNTIESEMSNIENNLKKLMSDTNVWHSLCRHPFA
jgi:hypothetical protein